MSSLRALQPRARTSTSRKLLAVVVTALASVAIFATLLAHYADNVLVNPGSFSDRAITVVHDGAVESLVVDTVTNRVLAYVGGQSSLRPTIETAVRDALSSPQISGEIRAAADSLQTQLLSGNANTLTLTLPNVGSVVASSVQPISPQLAAVVSRVGTVTVVDVRIPSAAAQPLHALGTAGHDFWLLLVVTIGLIVLALIVAPDRGQALMALGLAAFASGLLAVAIYLVGRGLIVNEFSSPDARTAAQTAWRVYLGGLETSGFVVAAVGAVAALGGAFV